MKKMIMITLLLVLWSVQLLTAQTKRPMMPEDLYQIKRVSDPQISPDGKWIAYTVSVPDLEDNHFNSDIWIMPAEGGESKQLTYGEKSDHSPRWSPDGNRIAFVSNRDGTSNIYLINHTGGEAQKLTHSDHGLWAPIWSRDGKHLLCRSRIVPEGKIDSENPYIEELPLCEARTINRLLYRQWDRWLGDKRNHLFWVNVADGSFKDVISGDFDTPPVSLGSGHDADISPDGSEICFVRTVGEELASSTNHDLFSLNIKSGKVEALTANLALDYNPHYSPDGIYIAYAAMSKVDYESDTQNLILLNRKNGAKINLTEGFDRSVDEILWHPNGKMLFFTARTEGRRSIFRVEIKTKKSMRMTREGYDGSIRISPDGKRLVFIRSYCHQPDEIYTMPANGGHAVPLTSTNQALMKEFDIPKLEEFWFEGAQGDQVHGFLLKPPGFKQGEKYPVVLTIHGGPQNMWADRFMTTWFTFPLIASPGYVGVYLNPRGSSGYGAKFREEVSRDYGGRCYQDLMAGLDYVLANYDFVDTEKLGVIGGSFGGYSTNWIMGHTDRFTCAVSHAGLYNLVSFFGATEELWYPAWDMGTNPWDDKEMMEKWSPHNFARNFTTPCLVIHGELDYRVPVAESFQLFTALQLQKIPSRLVYFPDEGHVIETPQNNVRWWKEIHRWFAEYLK